MKIVQTILFVFAILTLSAQLVHFTYKKTFYPLASVLDKQLDKNIRKTLTFDELVEKYNKADADVKAFEKGKTKEELKKYQTYRDEPFVTRYKLKNAVRDWERKESQRQRMIYYWFGGLVLILIGGLLYYFRQLWFGMGIIIAGLLEFLWWSSPSFSSSGAAIEYARILNTKLFLTVLSLLVVIVLWFAKDKHK